jgi:glycosyltransferase involved in cell wall biosynthesis
MKVSFVIPCLNEEETIGIVISKVIKAIKKFQLLGEVIVVDNGSTDDSSTIAEREGAKVIKCTERGNGNALRFGFDRAKGDFIIMLDADDSYNAEEIGEFLAELKKGAHLVLGSRLRGNMEPGSNPWSHRYIGTPIQTCMCNVLFGTKISDIHSGMRAFKKNILSKLKLESEGFELCTEMMIKAGVCGIKIKEIPINFYKDKRSRKPHLKTWTHGWAVFKYMFLHAPNKLMTAPGVSLFAIGTLLIALQIFGPFQWGWISMDIHFMVLGLMFAVVGFFMASIGIIVSLFTHLRYYYQPSSKLLQWIERKFTFNRGFFYGTSLLLLGCAIEILIFINWVNMGFEGISALRSVIIGFYFIFVGISLISFSFLFVLIEQTFKRNNRTTKIKE